VLNIGLKTEKIFLYSQKSFISLLIMGYFIVYFCSISNMPDETCRLIHVWFMFVALGTWLLSGYFRIFGIQIPLAIVWASYLIINNMRYIYGEDYIFSAGYNIWTILALPNLLLAHLLFYKRKKHPHWSFYYIFLLAQTAVIENLQNQKFDADSYYFYKHIGMMNYPGFALGVICLSVLLIRYIGKGRILEASSFATSGLVFTGIYLSEDLSAFGLFFLAAALVECFSALFYIYYTRNKDENLSISNYWAYLSEAEKKYPLKYSISLLYVDEYGRLRKRFGSQRMIELKKMFITRIKQVHPSVKVYNYKDDSLILAFMNMNATECFEQAEDIKRALAKSIFVFNENNHLQLTVSQSVSEKKRSDADARAVLQRAEESLQAACKFTHNITVKA
jgi:GGDEF domain-containing protein